MKVPRRKFLHLAVGAVGVSAASRIVWAQAYPSRPVRIVVGAPPGGATDILARLIGQWLAARFGQPFIIDNRPGAATNIGTEAVVRAVPDGYTLLLVTPPNMINATLYEKLSFNFIRDIAAVIGITRVPLVMQVNLSFPAKTAPEFIAYAKANPGQINFVTGGTGTAAHVAGELFKMMTGVTMTHVPYRGGGPALADLLGGHVQAMFSPMPESIGTIRAGQVRPLAVTTAMRAEALPEVPPIGDFVPGFEASSSFGLGAPRNTPAEIVDKLNKELNAALADDKLKARLADLGGTVLPSSPADFGKLIAG
jgi:tripartite-type tricarboxylate transporter receptor subunit TctC